ncbi:T9SS type A sorting domain-containing protein [Pseudotamlana carrageenivorans]|uniref:Secretion system C-terminal sorting domain-containing protein n=1 Tax=Pseudotamlana carrageenivorans TaxID=2069432 RepID=A0A2I7SK81_9FLAO|nr:T9SS type A sorting domain-containing protein [Tamlana carrageenivorans]AUS06309.1 hypothetical protein C1A40_13015 [Tamlana carrageenivorans]
MKKITLKFIAALFFCAFALQVQAQGNAFDHMEATYMIKVDGEDLYLTLPDQTPPIFGTWEQKLTYQPLNTAKPELQQFKTVKVPDGAIGSGFYYIESVIAGRGLVEILQSDVDSPVIGVKGNTAAAPSPDGLDVWNPTRNSGTQIFSENTCATCSWAGKAKRRIQTAGDGLEVKLNGGAGVTFSWEATTLSNSKFDTSSVFVSNPVKEVLSIGGLTSNFEQVSVYSLLGKEVITRKLNGNTSMELDVNALVAGIYIVEFQGKGVGFSKKIVKQ